MALVRRRRLHDLSIMSDDASWLSIPLSEVAMGASIGGGGVAIVYRGTFRRQPVALKTLVRAHCLKLRAQLKLQPWVASPV